MGNVKYSIPGALAILRGTSLDGRIRESNGMTVIKLGEKTACALRNNRGDGAAKKYDGQLPRIFAKELEKAVDLILEPIREKFPPVEDIYG